MSEQAPLLSCIVSRNLIYEEKLMAHSKHHFVRMLAAALAVVSILHALAFAKSEARTVEENVSASSFVLQARVLSSASRWNSERTLILTEFVCSVTDVIKGETNSRTITIAVSGGEVGEVGLVVSHEAVIAVGEDILVFLNKAEDGKFVVYGGELGKLSVEDGKVTETGESVSSLKTRISAQSTR
jgi:hypothetical protein